MNDSKEDAKQQDSAPTKIEYDEGGGQAMLLWMGGIGLVLIVLAVIASKS